ncbi:MAG TPA: hypothetical protein VKN64_00085 [Halanaerobiales bacterium]|nr:hypothetical protein [Halanaerobiales bacterium]
MIILSRGYYVSSGKVYEEWHAGIYMNYKIFSAKLFQGDNSVLVASIKTNVEVEEYSFKIGDFVISNNQSRFNIENSNLCTYREDGSLYQVFSIFNKYRLIDEFGVTFEYRVFESEEE